MTTDGVFSIGHSAHTFDHFLSLLKMHGIEAVADTRSSPYSRYAAQFNRPVLERSLCQSGLQYVYLGKELGGRPEGDEYYDDAGHVLYNRLAQSPLFLSGIGRLQGGITKYRVAVLCSEENPAVCHRALLIGSVLTERGVTMRHVRGDGRIEVDDGSRSRGHTDRGAAQLTFLEEQMEPSWRSVHPVRQRRIAASASAKHEVG